MPQPTRPLPATGRASRAASLRVFFALWPGASRDLVAALSRDFAEVTGGRAPRPGNIHLTLAFVGEVAPERVVALERIGDMAARTSAPFTLELGRTGNFRDAGIAWLGTDAIPPELDRLMRRLNEGLATAGFRVERRPFHAHVTLARRCRRPLPPRVITPVAWCIERLTLIASELSSQGSDYRELAAWPLHAA